MKHYLSFGGGVDSTALYLLMEKLEIQFEAIFVDHGCDLPETYSFIQSFIKTGRKITIIKPSKKSKKMGKVYNNIYDFAFDMSFLPSLARRWCTADFKLAPINKYINKPCWMHIGINAGEQQRAKISHNKGVENRWLLIEHDIDKQDCIELIQSAGLEIPHKSSCFFCPFQRVSQWKELRQNHPDLFCKAVSLELRHIDKCKSKNKKTYTLRHNGKSLLSMFDDSQLQLPFFNNIEAEYPPCVCGL